MTSCWLLYADDTAKSLPYLFHYMAPSGRCELRPEYAHLRCRRCRKFDESKALKVGIYGDHKILNEEVDYLKAYEDLAVVSTRMRETISNIPESNVTFHELPQNPGYYVAVPQNLIVPDPNSLVCHATNLCPECGRYRSVVWGEEQPRLDVPCVIAAFRLENRIGAMYVWVISDLVLSVVQDVDPPLKGFCIYPEDKVYSK